MTEGALENIRGFRLGNIAFHGHPVVLRSLQPITSVSLSRRSHRPRLVVRDDTVGAKLKKDDQRRLMRTALESFPKVANRHILLLNASSERCHEGVVVVLH